jgi:hypothetical protein
MVAVDTGGDAGANLRLGRQGRLVDIVLHGEQAKLVTALGLELRFAPRTFLVQ